MEPAVAPVDEAGDHGAGVGRLGGQLVQRRQVVADELGPQHEVLRRVAGDRQLGEAHEFRAGVGRGRGRRRHPLDVAGEIADREVQLAERDARHGISVARTARGSACRYSGPPMSTLYASQTRSAPFCR